MTFKIPTKPFYDAATLHFSATEYYLKLIQQVLKMHLGEF